MQNLNNLENKSPQVAEKGNTPESKLHIEGVNLDFLNEGEVTDAEVSENDKKAKSVKSDGLVTGTAAAITVRQKKPQTVQEMVSQIEKSIMTELDRCIQEEKQLKSSGTFKPSDLNSIIIKIRQLNKILFTLKDYLKLAEDYVVGLWNQFVLRK